jgi:hypothetical protein
VASQEIRVYAGYCQFYIQDSEPRTAPDDPTFWTKQSTENKLAVGDGILGIGTGSYAFVKVHVEDHRTKPQLDLAKWDHVTEAGLEVRSNLLLVFGCTANSGYFFFVEPGHYRVRCCHANLAWSENAGSTGEYGDWYLIQFWPAKPVKPRVLKQWVDSRTSE